MTLNYGLITADHPRWAHHLLSVGFLILVISSEPIALHSFMFEMMADRHIFWPSPVLCITGWRWNLLPLRLWPTWTQYTSLLNWLVLSSCDGWPSSVQYRRQELGDEKYPWFIASQSVLASNSGIYYLIWRAHLRHTRTHTLLKTIQLQSQTTAHNS